MKVSWERLQENEVEYQVEVDTDQFGKSLDKAYRKLVQRVNIPGFRRGKAPRSIAERYLGTEALIQEAVDALLPEAYTHALKESGLDPIDQPKVDIVQVGADTPFIFKAKVQVKPEVTLGALTGYDIKKEEPVVTEKEVDEQIEGFRERQAQLAVDEAGEVVQGSFAIIDFEGFIGDEAFEGGSGEGYTLEIGSGTFIPGFEEQLIGAKAGEEREVKVAFPSDYRAEHLAGKDASFKVTVREIKKKALPELDDNFAQQVSRHQTLQELRSELTNRLQRAAGLEARRDYENRLVQAVVDASAVESPAIMVDRRVERAIRDFEARLQEQGLSLEGYFEATKRDLDSLKAEFRPGADKAVKADLVLEAIAKQEGLNPTETEIDNEIRFMAIVNRVDEKQIPRLLSDWDVRDDVKDSLRRQKALQHLVKLQEPSLESAQGENQDVTPGDNQVSPEESAPGAAETKGA